MLWCYVERAFADSEPVCLVCEAGSAMLMVCKLLSYMAAT